MPSQRYGALLVLVEPDGTESYHHRHLSFVPEPDTTFELIGPREIVKVYVIRDVLELDKTSQETSDDLLIILDAPASHTHSDEQLVSSRTSQDTDSA